MILVDIGDGHHLAPGPAASYLAARAAGCPAGITSSTRTTAEQAALRAAWEADPVHNAFALPAGQSKHEKGDALDLKPAAAAWMRAHPEYGWRFTNPDEWWHAEWFAAKDTVTGGLPAPLTPRRRTMYIIRGIEKPEVWATDWIVKRHIATEGELTEALKLCGQTEPIVLGQYAVDRIPVWTPAGAIDVPALAAAVANALPKPTTGQAPTASAIADELAARLAH